MLLCAGCPEVEVTFHKFFGPNGPWVPNSSPVYSTQQFVQYGIYNFEKSSRSAGSDACDLALVFRCHWG